MKVVIPAAGTGTRLRPHTYTVPKSLIYVAGKPILGHILDRLAPYDPESVVLIIGHMGDAIVDYVRKHYPYRFEFIRQEEQRGLGHAVYQAKDIVKNDEALIILGDTIIDWQVDDDFRRECFIGVKKVAEPGRYGVVEIVGGYVKRLVEKPEKPPSDLAVVGVYYVTDFSLLAKAVEHLIDKDIQTRGEYQLTDALQFMVSQGVRLRPVTVEEWHDCGNVPSLVIANRYLLDRSHYFKKRTDSIIIPPCYIHDSAQTTRSIIGPYVSIGEGAIVDSSIIKDSIINPFAQVERVLLTDTIIGQKAVVHGAFEKLNVGDSSEMEST